MDRAIKAEQDLKRMDFTKDQRAWELARATAEPGENLSKTVERAQTIKATL